MILKLKDCKLANAVVIGPYTESFVKASEYDIALIDNQYIKINRKTNPQYECFTTLANVIFFHPDKTMLPAEEAKK